MINEDLKKLVTIMNFLAMEFDNSNPVPEERAEYWENNLLKKYGIKKLTQASEKLVDYRDKYQTGFPKISEMIRIIEGEIIDIKDIALAQFLRAKEVMNCYDNVRFDDPLIHCVINAMGGWIRFSLMETSEVTWKEKEFVQIYTLFSKQEKNMEFPQCLNGINNKYNKDITIVKTCYSKKSGIQIEKKDHSKAVLKKLFSTIKCEQNKENKASESNNPLSRT